MRTMTRTIALAFVLFGLASAPLAAQANPPPPPGGALDYPTRPVRLIVPSAAGGGTDITARVMGQWLSERLGQQFVIDNRPGGDTNIGTEAVVRSPADGYTLLMVGSSNATNATLYDKLNFNFIRDIAPVAGVIRYSLVMVVNPSVPAKSVPEFIAYAKANPGKLTMASAGTGATSHLSGELFKMMAGVDMVHLPYRGRGPGLTDLLGGQAQVYFAATVGSIEYIRTGRLRALAVTTTTRSDVLPDIPTLGEFVPGYEASRWFGVGAPKNTPSQIIDKLNEAINAGLADPKIKARLAELGGVPMPMSPAEFGKLIADDSEKWGKVIRALAVPAGRADNLLDEGVRVAMLERADGRLAHIETPYNDVFITKRQHHLVMSFQLKGWDYTESVSNLLDPDDLPLRYAQVMTIATIYPEAPRKILMLGLGGGSISTYLGRFMPEAAITTVEIDPGVITAAKTYFGLRETERMRYHAGDGRVFLNRNSELYDLILLDAYRGGYVPFHLLTREFYTLVKQRLTPGGAAAFNVNDGSKLYASTMKTLGEVFAALDLYPTGVGEVIAVARTSPLDAQTLERRAAALQQRHGFRFPLPWILQRRMDKPQSQAASGDVITDDFAPADVYDVMGKDSRRRR